MKLASVLVVVIAVVGAPICRGEDPPAKSKAPAYQAQKPAASWTTISGTCRIEQSVRVPMIMGRSCAGGTVRVPSPRIRFDPTHRGLADCVVHLRAIGAGKGWTDRDAYLLVANNRLHPHVQVVRPGTQLVLANLSGHEHNSHAFRDSFRMTQWNVLLRPHATLAEVGDAYLEVPGRYLVRADLCAHYSATVLVAAHPYYSAPTDTTGRFELRGVPPGTYELVCWHGGMQHKAHRGADGSITRYDHGHDVELARAITVQAGTPLTVDFTLPAPR